MTARVSEVRRSVELEEELIDEAVRKRRAGNLRIRYFLRMLLPILLIIGGLLYYTYNEHRSEERFVTQTEIGVKLEAMRQVLLFTLDSALGDLRFAKSIIFHESGEQDSQRLITLSLTAFADSKKMYDQIRLINIHGMEQLRINNRLVPELVPQEQLQDKSKRPYFVGGSKLEYQQVYIAPMDYNVEHEQYERPLKLVLRFITPIADSKHNPRGLLVTNYLGSHLFESIKYIRREINIEGGMFWITDAAGNVLHYRACAGGEGADGSLREMPLKGDEAFGRDYPAVWEAIQGKESGVFPNEEGIFSFRRVSPDSILREKGLVSDPAVVLGPDNSMYLLVYTPFNSMYAQAKLVLRRNLLFAVQAMGLLVGLAWLYAGALARRRELEDEIRKSAFTDPLTKTFNRRFGMMILRKHIAQSQRTNSPLTVFMIDVNNLKGVNDNYGHAAGDELINTIAGALRDHLRIYDITSRIGGDEFMVILPGTDYEHGMYILERLRNSVRSANEGKFPPFGIDFALGGTQYFKKYFRGEAELLAQADRQMYKDKETRKQMLALG